MGNDGSNMVKFSISRTSCILFFVIATTCLSFEDVTPLPLGVSVVDDGFSWVENLCFDDHGSMFATEFNRGQLLQIQNTGNEDKPIYQTTYLIDNNDGLYGGFLGCLTDDDRFPGIVFVLGQYANQTTRALFAVPVASPTDIQIVAYTTPGVGNGIGLHKSSGMIYFTSEGNFEPDGGYVYVVDPTKPWGDEATIMATQTACDGLWIDQDNNLLFVSLLETAEVWTYSLANGSSLGVYEAYDHKSCSEVVCMLDDFTLSQTDHSSMIGCAYTNGSLTTFPTFSPQPGYNEKTVLTSLRNPTSVRWGSGIGFASTSLFISEGGGVNGNSTRFRILEWKNANDYV
jgi:hypothetical protein